MSKFKWYVVLMDKDYNTVAEFECMENPNHAKAYAEALAKRNKKLEKYDYKYAVLRYKREAIEDIIKI